MSGNVKKEDLRVLKTYKALITAMSKLLELRNFNQITVNDLCKEALINRSTFYFHFIDKYDLLKCWLTDIKPKILSGKYAYEDLEKNINDFVDDNMKVIKNLIENANGETNELLCDFILSLLNVNIEKKTGEKINPSVAILSNFCCGGMLDYLFWQVKNEFPADFPVMNPYIYDMLTNLQKWNDKNAYIQ